MSELLPHGRIGEVEFPPVVRGLTHFFRYIIKNPEPTYVTKPLYLRPLAEDMVRGYHFDPEEEPIKSMIDGVYALVVDPLRAMKAFRTVLYHRLEGGETSRDRDQVLALAALELSPSAALPAVDTGGVSEVPDAPFEMADGLYGLAEFIELHESRWPLNERR